MYHNVKEDRETGTEKQEEWIQDKKECPIQYPCLE